MRSSIQLFTISREAWQSPLVIDFTESNCCILTGTNGGGKTLTMRMLALVGKWVADPNRYNFRQMNSLAEKTQIGTISIVIRTPIIEGQNRFTSTNHWTSDFNLDPGFIESEQGNSADSTHPDDYDFLINVASICETKVVFGTEFGIERRKKLSIHYKSRQKKYRSQRDLEWEQAHIQRYGPESQIPYDVVDQLTFEASNEPNVFEHGVIIEGEWKSERIGRTGDLPIYTPEASDLINDSSLSTLLEENGIIVAKHPSLPSKSMIQLPGPVALNVERRPEDIEADLRAIRELDSSLYDAEKLHNFVSEGHYLHNQRFNSDSPMSSIEMDAYGDDYVDVDPMTLQPFEQDYITMSQPYFPSWYAFKRFVGEIPAENYLSSGQLQLLSMTKAVLATDYCSLLMIDEPELSLHIDWQRELIHTFTSLFPHHSFLFSTHSPDILYNQIDQVLQVPPIPREDDYD